MIAKHTTTIAPMRNELRAQARELLMYRDAGAKASGTRALVVCDPLDIEVVMMEPENLPGRPTRPALVPFNALARRSVCRAAPY